MTNESRRPRPLLSDQSFKLADITACGRKACLVLSTTTHPLVERCILVYQIDCRFACIVAIMPSTGTCFAATVNILLGSAGRTSMDTASMSTGYTRHMSEQAAGWTALGERRLHARFWISRGAEQIYARGCCFAYDDVWHAVPSASEGRSNGCLHVTPSYDKAIQSETSQSS